MWVGCNGQNRFLLDSASSFPCQQRNIENMKKLHVLFRLRNRPCGVKYVGIDKTTASRREYKFSTWCGVFNAAAFHVEKLYRLMPVPWHSAADVAIQCGS